MFTFQELIQAKWDERKFVCVGLDSDYAKLPRASKKSDSVTENLVLFNLSIVDSTVDLVCAFKINSAFYEQEGLAGWAALEQTVEYIKKRYPTTPVILDAKRGDVGNTNMAYAKMAFDWLKVDSITLSPYVGGDALAPFFEYKNKCMFILAKTSNLSSKDLQDQKMANDKLVYQMVAQLIKKWNTNKNLGVVVGATFPKQLKEVRDIVGNMPFLVPGIGSQGGDLAATLKNGVAKTGNGLIINSSRSIIFASNKADFAHRARLETEKLHNEILKVL